MTDEQFKELVAELRGIRETLEFLTAEHGPIGMVDRSLAILADCVSERGSPSACVLDVRT